ncbi:SCO family protein [Cellulophaga fucicola]|uniref:SCO family protein n=1 Tax=Cellulophaga fucicola TaxID=76595 RepID=UPI003EB71BD0
MKNYSLKKINVILLILFSVVTFSCKETVKKDTALYQCPMHCEGDKTYTEPQKCPVCKMDMELANTSIKNDGEIPEMSIFNLPSKWTNQNNKNISLIDLKGDVLVMVMIYTTCTSACPRLVSDMRNIERQIPDEQKNNVKLVFVSIDPITDTPTRLKEFAKENQMDSDQFIFLTGSVEDTREFAAVLAVSYKQITPKDFSHSNIISVFNKEGVLIHQQEGLGVDNAETVAKIITESNY